MRFLLLFLLSASLCLCSCTAPTEDPLSYQRFPCTFALHGEICGVSCALSVRMDAAGRGTLSFLSPADLAGVQFVVHNLPHTDPEDPDLQYEKRGITVILGEVSIPLSEGTYPASIYSIVQALSLSAERLTDVESSSLTYTYPDGYVTLTISSTGAPTCLAIDLYGTVSTLYIDQITYEEAAA